MNGVFYTEAAFTKRNIYIQMQPFWNHLHFDEQVSFNIIYFSLLFFSGNRN